MGGRDVHVLVVDVGDEPGLLREAVGHADLRGSVIVIAAVPGDEGSLVRGGIGGRRMGAGAEADAL